MLRPKTPSEIANETALELGIPQEEVEKIVTAYYKEVRRCLIEGKGLYVYVHNLGYFKIKKKPLQTLIIKLESQIKKYENRELTPKLQKNLNEIRKNYVHFKSLYEELEKEQSKSLKIRHARQKNKNLNSNT